MHLIWASPSYPGVQEQTGICLITLQIAFSPQAPGQGSIQRSFLQALLLGHSAFIVHSGRQFGGRPT